MNTNEQNTQNTQEQTLRATSNVENLLAELMKKRTEYDEVLNRLILDYAKRAREDGDLVEKKTVVTNSGRLDMVKTTDKRFQTEKHEQTREQRRESRIEAEKRIQAMSLRAMREVYDCLVAHAGLGESGVTYSEPRKLIGCGEVRYSEQKKEVIVYRVQKNGEWVRQAGYQSWSMLLQALKKDLGIQAA